jgi:RHS repeat-associated protein
VYRSNCGKNSVGFKSHPQLTYDGSGWEQETISPVQYLLYDGQGSTRQLAEYDPGTDIGTDTVSTTESYSYDGYGVMLGSSSGADAASNADTSMLYAGEQFDTDAQMYYNRARYYNPSNGLFNRVDPYAGNNQDPQSLHKYTYCHNNPVNNIDPTGMFVFSLSGLSISMAIYKVA